MEALRGVVFDMDDTLYLERDYVRSGFLAVGEAVGPGAFEFLWDHFERGTRGNTFDLLVRERGAAHTVEALVARYREHAPTISPFPEFAGILAALREGGLRLGLVSDGPHASQAAKLAALGGGFEPAILTGAWGAEFSKPHPRAFETIADAWGLPASALAYVGDNPKKDFVAPNRLGWRSIRLRLPGGLHEAMEPAGPEFAATVEVRSLDALATTLRGWTEPSVTGIRASA